LTEKETINLNPENCTGAEKGEEISLKLYRFRMGKGKRRIMASGQGKSTQNSNHSSEISVHDQGQSTITEPWVKNKVKQQ